MVDNRLVNYIKQYSSQGYSSQQIAQTLLKNGYSESIIQEAFYAAQNNIQNTSPLSPTNIYQRSQTQNQNYNQHDYHSISTTSQGSQKRSDPIRNIKLIMVAIVIVLLILGGVYMFVLKGSNSDPNITHTSRYTYEDPDIVEKDTVEKIGESPAKEVSDAEDLKLAKLNGDEEFLVSVCSEIKNDYTCIIKDDKVYTKGDKIKFLFIYKAKTVEVNGGFRIGFIIKREVYDPNNQIVFKMSSEGFPIIREYPIEVEVETPFAQEIYTNYFDTPGEYTFKFTVIDRYTFEETEFTNKITIV